MDSDTEVAYTTPQHVQVWFLRRSRKRWKKKCLARRVELKRLANRVADLQKSREKWKAAAQAHERRIQELEAENAALREQHEGGKRRTAERVFRR